MQSYFAAGNTRKPEFRKKQLIGLKEALYKFENEIYEALYSDLKKNKEECWVTEIGFTIAEINYCLKNLSRWMKRQPVTTNLLNLPGSSYILHEPLGIVLIIGPWNYPLQLVLTPLVGAIAAGNCAVVKPSEFAPATASILQKIISETFEPDFIYLVQGDGASVVPEMMNIFRFDHVFYTGSTEVGKIIYEMAAKKLVPVTLELGGKSPCIVESDADIKVAARRIAMTKFSNAGQMCVAPDYVLVHESIKEKFITELTKWIEKFYLADNYHYGKIIHKKSFERIVKHIQNSKVIFGGEWNAKDISIEPTLIEETGAPSELMNEEIFGPLLPIISWKKDEEVFDVIRQNKNPLALYVFTGSNSKADKWTSQIPFGGGCINNASWHLTNHHLPFGGRGNSGFGAYHGKFSFETFSHKKAIMRTPTWFDPALKYPPFKGKLSMFKKLIR
jgi:aldehyde dehydrogenase (NAD+)